MKVEASRSGGRAEVKPGDWSCDQCRVNNFARRDTCFRCGAPKRGDRDDDRGGGRDGGYDRGYAFRPDSAIMTGPKILLNCL
jgi:hypothetical protein